MLGKRRYVKQSTITTVSEISGFMTVVQRLMNDSIYLAKIHTNRYSRAHILVVSLFKNV